MNTFFLSCATKFDAVSYISSKAKMYVDFNCGFTLVLIIIIFVLAFLSLKKYVQFYLKFPNGSVLLIVLRWFLMTRFNKNAASVKTTFEMVYDGCKKSQKDGICIYWLLRPFVVICSDEAMKVLANEQCILSKVPEYKILEECLGTSLFTMNGDEWRRRRKILNPVFRIPVLKHHVPMINENSIALVNKLMKMPNETPVVILRYLQSCAFASIYEFLSGNNANDPERAVELEDTVDNINRGISFMGYRLWRPWLYPACLMKFSSAGQKYLKIINNIQEFAKKILLEMEESVLSSEKEKDVEKTGFYDAPKCFAQVLIEQKMRNSAFTFQDMQDEVTQLIITGFDTVSHSVMWALFMLGHHNEVQEKLFDEIDSGMPSELTFDDFKHLPYLDSVIKEVLRLYPTAPIYGRRIDKNVDYGKYTFPKDTNILFFTYMVHRDPKIYADPENFNPERFLEKEGVKKTATYAFAEGIRTCIGKQFALMEIKIIVAHLIRNFKVTSLDRKEDVRVSFEIVLTSTKPIRMKFTPRGLTETDG